MSNVTGHNLDLLKSFLNLLTTRMPVTDDQPAEFQIDETYSVPVSDLFCNYTVYYADHVPFQKQFIRAVTYMLYGYTQY